MLVLKLKPGIDLSVARTDRQCHRLRTAVVEHQGEGHDAAVMRLCKTVQRLHRLSRACRGQAHRRQEGRLCVGGDHMTVAPDSPPLGGDAGGGGQARQGFRIGGPGAASSGRGLPQHQDRARRDGDGVISRGPAACVVRAVAKQRPGEAFARLRQDQSLRESPAVDRQDHAIQPILCRRHKDHDERLPLGIVPVRRRKLCAVRLAPGHIRIRMARARRACQEPIRAEGGALAPERRQPPGEGEKILVRGRPVQPADGIVLGIAIVVATLGASELVAHGQHRRPARQEQAGQ